MQVTIDTIRLIGVRGGVVGFVLAQRPKRPQREKQHHDPHSKQESDALPWRQWCIPIHNSSPIIFSINPTAKNTTATIDVPITSWLVMSRPPNWMTESSGTKIKISTDASRENVLSISQR